MELVLLAQNVLVNSVTKNPSFIEVFSEFRLPTFPFTVGGFFVVILMRDVHEPVLMEIEVRSEREPGQRALLWTGQMHVETPPNASHDPSVFAALGVQALSITEEGKLAVIVKLAGQEDHRRYYRVLPAAATLAVSADT